MATTVAARRSPAAPPGETMAPPLAGSPRVQGHRDYVVKALLNGLTGPVDGRTYTQVMIPMGTQNDDWIASVGSYVRSSFGNDAPLVAAADVARVRLASARRKTSWTVAEIESSLPVPLDPAPTWKVTASHNSAAATVGSDVGGLDVRPAAAERHVVSGRVAGARDDD